jgi:hypothetical protein
LGFGFGLGFRPPRGDGCPRDLAAAIRRIVIGVVEEHPGLPDAAVLALTYARLLEEPAFRAEVFAVLLALEEDGRR